MADPIDADGAYGDTRFSFDGRQVVSVYGMAEAGNITTDIWVVESKLGSVPINLTKSDGVVEVHPTWSPDNSQISYVAWRGTESGLMVMNADGSNPINLTGNATQN